MNSNDETTKPPNPEFRSGFVAVVGRPNVGKSTLMNYLLGEKLAIVSPKPQTTREKQLGILTNDHAQVVFIDTPGIHSAKSKLGAFMVESALHALANADVILFLVDLTTKAIDEDEQIASHLSKTAIPVVLALNKSDVTSPDGSRENEDRYRALVPNSDVIRISAATGDNVSSLFELLVSMLPVGPYFYPPDQLTDTFVRDNVAEIIREKILTSFEDEIPHSAAVQVEEFKERSETLTYIQATVYVEKDSQKGIIIGDKGSTLKKLGAMVRPEIEELLGTSVYLELWVKVLKNWRRDERALKRLGYYHKS